MVEDLLVKYFDIKVLVFVYVEIFIGVRNDVKVLCELVNKY